MTPQGETSGERGPTRPGKARTGRAAGGGDGDGLSRLLDDEAVVDGPVSSKDDLLRRLCAVVIHGAAPSLVDEIYAAVQEREAAVNTYVGEGVAIPHARLDSVQGMSIAIARDPRGFPYGLDTDQPVRIAVLVVGQELLHDEHVRVLGSVANVLKDPVRREEILRAPNVGEIRRLLDAVDRERSRRKGRPLSHVLLTFARRVGRELGVAATIVSTDSREDLATLSKIVGGREFIIATSSHGLHEEATKRKKRTILLPQVTMRREARMRLAALLALTHGLIHRGDVVTFVSGDKAEGLDSLTILEIGREFGRFVKAGGEITEGIHPAVLERVLTLATELALEGREGRPVGTIFVVGDSEQLAPFCQQMVMNPFRGYPDEERNILDPTLAETIKEFAAIDGAFVIRGDGVVQSAGTFLKVGRDVMLPGGYGSRHRAACGISDASDAIAITISQSTGEVNLFKNGAVVLTLPRSLPR